MMQPETILEKVKGLSPDKINEVINYIDFIKEREKFVVKAERTTTIAEYARQNAQTEADLDPLLELAGIESLMTIDEVGT